MQIAEPIKAEDPIWEAMRKVRPLPGYMSASVGTEDRYTGYDRSVVVKLKLHPGIETEFAMSWRDAEELRQKLQAAIMEARGL